MKKTLVELKEELKTITLRLNMLSHEAEVLDRRGRAMSDRHNKIQDEICQIEELLRND